ncbi:hypothetical protein BC938DRAFT_476933 [Jimgerdemannia flammicorona]|uniref:Uncharacterized protein n=1 Tax=Jimgerdemannia flammicorona TaxID=994334 RepID=A0A433PD56_9FUNG|nr:hypothetical protein BC938DRAFT_476933 [Jimgerdemannia flammicorona]
MPPKKSTSATNPDQPGPKRGRPRKPQPSETEDPAPETEKTENGEDSSAEDKKSVDKPKRGRPPKSKSVEVAAPAPVAAAPTVPAGEPPAKRPRGRPPKPRDPQVEAQKVTGPKRGRGRPRKNQTGMGTNTKKTQATKSDDDVSMEEAEDSKPATILESGHIYFFYRPKVDAKEANAVEDVQRLYFVLKPKHAKAGNAKASAKADASNSRKNRLVVVPRKKLPETHQKARYWGFVRKTAADVKDLASYLDEEKYETKTKGPRTVAPARPAGEGVYAIVEHDHHTHLAYVLTLPKQPGEVQEAFNITKEGSFIISVKNPDTTNPPYAGLSSHQKAHFPSHLRDAFRGRRFIPVDTTEYLDVDNCEILLIGASEDEVVELGSAGEELHKMELEDEEVVTQLGEDNAIFEELRMDKSKHPVDPLHGEWK